jgi:hypothetical protein
VCEPESWVPLVDLRPVGRGLASSLLEVFSCPNRSQFLAPAQGSARPSLSATLKAGTGRDWGPTVDPAHLADLLWNMHNAKGEAEARYPA